MNPLKIPQNSEISYLEADINYTIFHLKDGKKIVSAFTLKRYEEDSKLAGFLRVNKSYLLNPEYVKGIEKAGRKATVFMQKWHSIAGIKEKNILNFWAYRFPKSMKYELNGSIC